MNGTIKEFFQFYLPRSKFIRAYKNALAFMCQDEDQAEIDALEATLADLQRRKRIIVQQISILQFELTSKKYHSKSVDGNK